MLLPFPKTVRKGVNGWSTWVGEGGDESQSSEDPGATPAAGELALSVMMGLPNFLDDKKLVRKFLILIILFNSNNLGLPTRSW